MSLSFYIAKRYLFGKKSISAINVITGVTVFGITLGTAALILILSIFNGFSDLVGNLFNAFNPDIKITPVEGKSFALDTNSFNQLMDLEEVLYVASTLEEKALLEYKEQQDVGTVKGVDSAFIAVTTFDSTLRKGYYTPWIQGRNQAAIGSGLALRLGINTYDAFQAMKVYLPNRDQKYALDKPFISRPIQPTGIFSFQQEYDHEYVIVPLEFVQGLTGKNEIGALEIKLQSKALMDVAKRKISDIMGSEFQVIDRYEQDAEFLRLMKIEKWMGFAITSLTMLILSFTIIGALWMIVLDKKLDISILKSMGTSDARIQRIFFCTGFLMSALGVVLGVIVAVVFYALQKRFGLIGMIDGFIVNAYPIRMQWSDLVISILTVLGIGSLASLLPARKASEMDAFVHD